MVCLQTKNFNLGKFLGGFEVGIIFGHLEYLTAIWYALWPFGIFSGHLVNFSQYWYVVAIKLWQPFPEVKFTYRSKYPQYFRAFHTYIASNKGVQNHP
jgi:hypothetical protein